MDREDIIAAKGKEKQTKVTASTESTKEKQPETGDNDGVVYFNAVPVGLSAREERRAREAKRAQEEEDEIAAFLPMLQDYLRSKPSWTIP